MILPEEHWRDFNDPLMVWAERLCADQSKVPRVSDQLALQEGCCCEVEVNGQPRCP